MAEKGLTEISRDARALFTKGSEAFERQNYDYAIALLQQVLEREPGFFECRRMLRAAQVGKVGASTGFFRKMLSGASLSPQVAKAQYALRKNPAEALVIAEQILSGDPQSSAAHRVVAEAAKSLGLPQTAVLSLEILWKNSPRDKALTFQLAEALADAGENGRAEKLLSDLYQAHPNDGEILHAMKNVSARRTMSEGGYESFADGTGSFRDALKDKEEAVSLEQEKRVVKTDDVAERLIGEYEARLPAEPGNLKLLRSLAELYTQKRRFDEALAYYQRIKASEAGADPSLDRAIADTTARKFDHALAQLDPQAADYAERSAKIGAEKLAYQLAECRNRADRYPTDLAIRFEMGQLYFQAGQIGEAIQEFQKAQSNPHKRIPALYYLGQCFARRGINDLAARTLQNAIKEKAVFDDEKKELIYALGSVLEKMGKREEAIEQFKLIYEADIGYQDVAAKIDAYYAGK